MYAEIQGVSIEIMKVRINDPLLPDFTNRNHKLAIAKSQNDVIIGFHQGTRTLNQETQV